MDYRISGERLKGFADQARRLGKISGELTPGQIEEVLRGVTVSAALPSIHPLLIAVDVKPTILPKFAVNDINIVVDASLDVFAKAEDTTPPPPPKYSYNGVVLPEIPADVLVEYPYAFIGFVASTGKYQILASADPMYFDTSAAKLTRQNSNTEPFLYCSGSDTTWTAGTSGNYGWTIDSDRQLVWSNHDIPNGSADATEIYFEGSEPVLAE